MFKQTVIWLHAITTAICAVGAVTSFFIILGCGATALVLKGVKIILEQETATQIGSLIQTDWLDVTQNWDTLLQQIAQGSMIIFLVSCAGLVVMWIAQNRLRAKISAKRK